MPLDLEQINLFAFPSAPAGFPRIKLPLQACKSAVC
jgi:hypothetical protein